MPRTTFICEVSGEYIRDQECLTCAMRRTKRLDIQGKMRHCQYPYPYIAACIEADSGRREERAGVSATMIAAECARKAVWEPRIPYGLFPHEMQPSIKGTAQHTHFERFQEEGVLAEVRLAKVMPSGRVITGKIDRYLPWAHRIEDYKFKSESHEPFKKAPLNYVAQQNIYKYMLEDGCVIHESGEIIPAQPTINELVLYPSNHKDWFEVYCPLWSHEQTIWLIETMLDIHGEAEDCEYLPPRLYNSPETTRFCHDYCPFWRQCCEAGGEQRDLLVEVMQMEKKSNG